MAGLGDGGAVLGVPGAPGGGTDVAIGPDTFRNPITSVNAFLAALNAKDKDKLAETTAHRAATEAVEKHRKMFAEILDRTVSDEQIDELSQAMQGYQVMYPLPAISTGKIGVVVAKMQGNDQLRRTIMVRKEKEGWKVMDIDNAIDFKMNRMPSRRRR